MIKMEAWLKKNLMETSDENSANTSPGAKTRSYYDQFGRMIMTRSWNNTNEMVDTYYVYDEFDQLVIIIPPKAFSMMTGDMMTPPANNAFLDTEMLSEDLIYTFSYDQKHRLVEKKVPGREHISLVYDVLDRVSLSQDGNLRTGSAWEFYKYDVFGRLVMTGLKQDLAANDQPVMQANADAYPNGATTFAWEQRTEDTLLAPDHYPNKSFPIIAPADPDSKPMVCRYFDTYPVDVNSGRYRFRTDQSFPPVTQANLFLRLEGVSTAEKTRKLDPTDESFLMTVYYYDRRLRPVEVLSDNHFGGLDAAFFEYDFEGKLVKSLYVHNFELPAQGNFTTEKVYENFDYDSHGRLKTHWHRLNRMVNPVILSAFTYNELGQVVEKKLHSTNAGLNFLQNVDYRYNTRGWRTNINRCDLTNSNIFTNSESETLKDQIVKGIRLDTLNLSIFKMIGWKDEKYIKIRFDGRKQLTVADKDNPASEYLLVNNETASNVYYQSHQEDSLRYSILDGLNTGEMTFNLNILNFGENDDPQELMDTIAKLIGSQLTVLNITDSATRAGIIPMAQVYEKSVIGVVYFNKDSQDLFGMDILYNEGFSQANAPAQYNGNISGIRWQQAANAGQRGYGFQYNRLNELNAADYIEKSSTGWDANPGKYDEKEIEYDKNGNILTLKRTGPTRTDHYETIDDLHYVYDGNRLRSVQDNAAAPASGLGFVDLSASGDEYGYDANGNLTRDDNKGITSIVYNYLNLPVEIHFDNTGNNKILYLYDADGTKLRKRVYMNGNLVNEMDYTSGALYTATMGGAPKLQYLATSEGRVVKDKTGYSYQYFLTDHLRNVRVVFSDDNHEGVAEVVQDNHYYPFGMTMSYLGGLTQGGLDNPFKYQGKELQEDAFEIAGKAMIHLDLYDFHARQYDPQLGRWHVPDPLNQHASPYLAMGNNPVSLVDVRGVG